jgi:tetratricopeptide (TPR) repeat protein
LLFGSFVTLASANGLFSQASIREESPYSMPLNRMFDEQHAAVEESEVQKLNRKALEAMGKQDWKTASTHLMSAMKADGTDPNTYINFGVFHFMREEYPSSEKALLKALEVDPGNAKANYHYSQVLVIKGEKEQAMNAAKHAVELSEENEWKYLEWLGELEAGAMAYREAVDSYGKALRLLQGKVDRVASAIKAEESRQEVADSYTDVEIVTDQGGVAREVEVQKFRYEYKEAPEAWHQLKASLESRMQDIRQRQAEALKHI